MKSDIMSGNTRTSIGAFPQHSLNHLKATILGKNTHYRTRFEREAAEIRKTRIMENHTKGLSSVKGF